MHCVETGYFLFFIFSMLWTDPAWKDEWHHQTATWKRFVNDYLEWEFFGPWCYMFPYLALHFVLHPGSTRDTGETTTNQGISRVVGGEDLWRTQKVFLRLHCAWTVPPHLADTWESDLNVTSSGSPCWLLYAIWTPFSFVLALASCTPAWKQSSQGTD